MAASRFPTTQYASTHFLESCGAILFRRSTRQIGLLNFPSRNNEWLLAKGRRNIGESRAAAAVREVQEESGVKCKLTPVTLHSRLCPAVEVPGEFTPDEVRRFEEAVEPFMMSVREVGEDQRKLIWWFVGEVVEEADGKVKVEGGEKEFEVGFFGFEEAVEKLTFETDRIVLRKAIEIWVETFEKEK